MMPGERAPITVSELNEYARKLVSGDALLRGFEVVGEITGYKHHSSGHRYFYLKDENCRVQCAMFRQYAANLPFKPVDGMRVKARASASVFPRDGAFQVYVYSMEQAGQGDLYVRFERLKQKLLAEGLFDPARKREIPKMPCVIGVATSHTGHAIGDIVKVSRQRNPGIGILVATCQVKGEGAAQDIARAIRLLNANAESDVILVGRGGGPAEEMWVFNEEVVARAIADSRIPVITCVGHEYDFTIADFVADLRASTPSAAAALAVPEVAALRQELSGMLVRLASALESGQRVRRLQMEKLAGSPALTRPVQAMVEPRRLLLERLEQRLAAAVPAILQKQRHRLDALSASLRALDPEAVLERGYAIVRQDDAIVPRAGAVDASRPVRVCFSDGEVTANVTEIKRRNERNDG